MNILHIVSVVCFALCLLMFFYFKWYIKKRTQSSGLDERRTEIARLIAEIDRITDRDSLLVEERILKLKEILEDTDKRIALYLKELEKSRAGESLYSSLGRGIRDALSIQEEQSGAPPKLIEDSVNTQSFPSDTIRLSPAAAANTGAQSYQRMPSFTAPAQTPAPPPKETQPPVSAPPSKMQIRSHIDLLLDEGISAEEIALRLGISVAEVNLAINLRRRK